MKKIIFFFLLCSCSVVSEPEVLPSNPILSEIDELLQRAEALEASRRDMLLFYSGYFAYQEECVDQMVDLLLLKEVSDVQDAK